MESRVIAALFFLNSSLTGSIVESRVIDHVKGKVCFNSRLAGSIVESRAIVVVVGQEG